MLIFQGDINMVECGNLDCLDGRWFHADCVGRNPCAPLSEEWFCSDLCKESEYSSFCLCRRKKSEDYIKCSAADDCKFGAFFHPACVGVLEKVKFF